MDEPLCQLHCGRPARLLNQSEFEGQGSRSFCEKECEMRADIYRRRTGKSVLRFGNWWGTTTGEYIAGFHEVNGK